MSLTRFLHQLTPRSIVPAALAGALAVSVLFTAGAAADSSSPWGRRDDPKPTVVLVHGAFADASS